MKNRKLLFFGILFCYAFMYIATSKRPICDGDCEKVRSVRIAYKSKSYVLSVERCSFPRVSDTLCIYVKDTTGINWNQLADTTCIVAAQQGLSQQKVFILKTGTVPFDTLARKICP
jgi:hypothetical protein